MSRRNWMTELARSSGLPVPVRGAGGVLAALQVFNVVGQYFEHRERERQFLLAVEQVHAAVRSLELYVADRRAALDARERRTGLALEFMERNIQWLTPEERGRLLDMVEALVLAPEPEIPDRFRGSLEA